MINNLLRNKKFNSTLLLVVISMIFYYLIDPYFLLSKTVFYNFQMRDLFRAREILDGTIILYGPELTGGGNTPGSLYYIILALGLYLKNNWMSSWIILIGFVFSSALMGYYFFKKEPLIAISWVILFTTAPFTSWFVKAFLNVSYLIPFAVLTIIFYLKAFENKSLDRKYFYWAFLIIGLGIQIHFSLICFLIPLVGYYLLYNQKISNKTFKPLLVGFLFFILPVLPHLIWIFLNRNGIHFGKEAFYSGKTEESLPSMLYIVKLTLSTLKGKLIYSTLKKIFFTFPYVTYPAFFTVAFYFKQLNWENRNKYLLLILGAIIPYLSWYISGQAHRYTIPFYILMTFLTITALSFILNDRKKIFLFNILASLTIFTVIGFEFYENGFVDYTPIIFPFLKIFFIQIILIIGLCVYSKKISTITTSMMLLILTLAILQKEFVNSDRFFNSKTQEGYMLSYDEWKQLFQNTIGRTEWSIDELLSRTYFIGHHVNQSPKLAYEVIKEQINFNNIDLKDADGFIISNRFGSNSMRKRKNRSSQEWILKQNVHKSIKDSLIHNELELGENVSSSSLIIPYYSRQNNFIPQHFQNNSIGYLPDLFAEILNGLPTNQASIVNGNQIVFKWNNCPDHNNYCSNGAVVTYQDNFFDIKVVGSAISQITPWISPNWTESWQGPYLKIVCNNKTYVKNLIDSIGFQRSYSHQPERTPFFAGNNSISAPIEFKFKSPCHKNINQLIMGRKSSIIDKLTSTEIITVPEITYKFN